MVLSALSIGEPVRVGAIFGNGKKIRPVWFAWRGRKYTVQEITYTWREQEGRTTYYHFSVYDGSALYELVYNARSLTWQLRGLEAASDV